MQILSSFLMQAIAWVLLMLASLGIARAQETPPDELPVQTVQVSGVRDPAIMPYREYHELMLALRNATQDHVAFQIRVTSSKTKQPLEGLEIVLRGPNTDEKLAISPTGFVTVPLNQAAYDDHAEFISNKKKGAIRVELFLVPRLPAPIRYADMQAAIKAANAARKELFPWYLRLLIPSVQGVGLCYPTREQAVAVHGAGEQLRQALVEDTDTMGAKVYCAAFSGNEARLDATSVIAPADGWSALFR